MVKLKKNFIFILVHPFLLFNGNKIIQDLKLSNLNDLIIFLYYYIVISIIDMMSKFALSVYLFTNNQIKIDIFSSK